MVKTGRTSSKPNHQNFPACPKFRAIIRPSPGHKFVDCDYTAVELRTLAATCKELLGRSVLADTMKAGVDPHAYTAAMINSIPLAEFMELKKTEPERFKKFRQEAKACNFGVPGGLGGTKLQLYAAAQYGVVMSKPEAEEFRRALIEDIYPELNEKDGYLASPTLESVAFNAGLSLDEVKSIVGPELVGQGWFPFVLEKVAAGNPFRKDGQPYADRTVSEARRVLKEVAIRSPKGCLTDATRTLLLAGAGAPGVDRELTQANTVTITGRVRGKVRYTETKNTRFQGLASDGGKLALFRLVKEGFKNVAFIHDQFLVEILDKGKEHNQTVADYIGKAVCEEMDKVLYGHTTAQAEPKVCDYWSK